MCYNCDMEERLFSVSPMAHEVTLTPGKEYQGSIRISVPSDATEELKYAIEVVPYTINKDNYGAKFDESTDYTTIVDWTKVEEPEGTLKPNEIRDIKYTIDVPESAPGGGQYLALLVRDNSETKKGEGLSIDNTFELASIIYAKIDGELTREAEIQSNSVPGFSLEPKIETSATLVNNGNIHEQAIIETTITNKFTGETVYPENTDEAAASEMVMPDSTRNYTKGIDGLPMMGVFDVKQTIFFGNGSDTAEGMLIICPIWFMLLVFLVIGAIIAGIVARVMRHKKKTVL